MPKLSAGLLLYNTDAEQVVHVLIVHPGGPFWAKKDDGAWSIPKGEYDDSEEPHQVALREFEEELGSAPPDGDDLPLGQIQQPSGKRLTVWARQGTFRAEGSTSNTFEMEWPRGSGNLQEFPEVDRAEWFTVADARVKLLKGHVPFLDGLLQQLAEQGNAALKEGIGAPTQPTLFE